METFHDLMWRAVQKGKPNDPDLMYQLARAQALSGRPDDALVMLERLADQGVASDAATNEDFRRVRDLKGWPELAARLDKLAPGSAGTPASHAAEPEPRHAPVSSAPAAPAPASRSPAAGTLPTAAAPAPAAPAPAAPAPAAPAPSASATALPAAVPPPPEATGPEPTADIVPFTPPFDPVGFAHDAVSRRFVLADRAGARLIVIDDASYHQATLVSAASAGFDPTLTGFTIDTRRGDLWVVSTTAEDSDGASTLHKLQLVSGRSLGEVKARADRPSRFCGVTVTPDGTVYVIDAAGPRLLRLRPGARALEDVLRLNTPRASSIAAADDRTLFVGSDRGIVRIDLAAGRGVRLKTAEDAIEIVGVRSGALFAVEHGKTRSVLVRFVLDPSLSRVVRRDVLMPSVHGSVAALTRDGVYYLAAPGIIRHLAFPH